MTEGALIRIGDEEKTIRQWSEISKVPIATIRTRIHRGYSGSDLIAYKLKPKKKIDKKTHVWHKWRGDESRRIY